MEIKQETVYIVDFENDYQLMLKDGKDSKVPSIEFYIKRKSDINWLFTSGVLYGNDIVDIIKAKAIDWSNLEHIQRLINFFADEVRKVEIPLYTELMKDIDNLE